MRSMWIFALALLASCATPETVWVRAGSTEQEFHRDAGQCRAQAVGSSPFMNSLQIAVVYSGCMEGKGWHVQEVRK